MNILIVKIAAIGDVIMSLTMLTAIREKYPNAHITWICGKGVSLLLKQFSIDEIIEVDEKKLLAGSLLEKAGEILSLWSHICFKGYELKVIAHGDKRYRILALPVRCAHATGFGKIKGKVCPIPGRYHGDEYARLITGVEDDSIRSFELPKFQLTDSVAALRTKYIKVIALAPGGAKNILRDDGCRRWPINSYVQLASMLLENGCEVVLTGAKSDSWIEPYFKGLNIENKIGKTNLLELAVLYRNVSCVVTHDSGPMHVAILARAKVVAIFGPTNPSEKVKNNSYTRIIYNTAALPCCPCYDGKYYAPCAENACMTGISVKKVFSEIQKLMNS
jgi:ADP-heptose:LPS heptosyltransferase